MASLKQSTLAAGNEPVQSADGQEPIVIVADFDLANPGSGAAGALVVNDIIEMCPLPAGYVVSDLLLDTTDLDTDTAAITLDVGLLSGAYRANSNSSTMGAEYIAGSTAGQAGGLARMSAAGSTKVAPTTGDRAIGVKCAVAPATGATTGVIRLTVTVRPQINGI